MSRPRSWSNSPRPNAGQRLSLSTPRPPDILPLCSLHDHTGQPVAVLIDEYDKPILDALEVPDIARANRDFLRGLYAVIKDCDAHVRFTFITG